MTPQQAETRARQLPAKIANLPAFPPVAIRVLNLIADEEDVEIKKLLEYLVADPVFSAELLRAANSALYGLNGQIDNVQHALMILGLDRIKTITLTVATRFFLRDVKGIDLIRRYWRHSLACALIADELARAYSSFQDIAYTAALLHDVGRLALLAGCSEEYLALIEEANATVLGGEYFDIRYRERQLFGIDHYEAGGLVAEKWKLPEELAAVVGAWEEVSPEGRFDLPALVRLAAQLAISLGFDVITAPDPPAFEELVQQIPETARCRFPMDMGRLREELQAKIDSYDLASFGQAPTTATAKETAQRPCPVEPAVREEREIAAEEAPPEAIDAQSLAAAGNGGRGFQISASDIAVFCLSTLIFIAILLAVFSRLFD